MARPRTFTDAELLTAARDCFLELGPAASTATIAERVGISQAALFKRFGSKDELLLAALLPEQIPELIEQIDAGPDERPLCDQLTDLAGAVTRFFHKLVPRLSVLRASGLTHEVIHSRLRPSPLEQLVEALTRWFGCAQQRGLIRPGHAKNRALQMTGALQVRPFLAHLQGRSPATRGQTDYIAELVATLCQGLATDEDH